MATVAAAEGKPMELRQIRCFVAVYEEGSFSRAAARQHGTQPGLSVAIRQLEAVLGQALFERNPRGVTPTIAGKRFYESATAILGAVKSARQGMLDLSGRIAGRINIGLPPSFSTVALPAVLARYAGAHPHVEVRLAEAYSGTLSQWVVAGELELAIVTEPPADLGLESTHFFRDRLVLVRAPRAPGAAGAADGMLKLVMPSGRHSLRQKIESHPRFGAPHVERLIEIDGLMATLAFVRSSDWWTVLPNFAVADDLRAGRLASEPFAGPQLWLDYFLVQTKDRPLSAASRHFLQDLEDELRRIGARGVAQPVSPSGGGRRGRKPPGRAAATQSNSPNSTSRRNMREIPDR